MKLSKYLHDDAIDLNLRGRSKKEVILNLAELLRGNRRISNFDAFIRDVLQREKEFSTGIGEGIAIPHARTNAVSDFVVAIGKIPSGIPFQSIDNMPVDIVILMGTPDSAKRPYLQFLATLSLMLKRKGFLDALRKAKNPVEVIDIFRENEALFGDK